MPEAVIVATARSPIGRAGKGSLTGISPDDLVAQVHDDRRRIDPQDHPLHRPEVGVVEAEVRQQDD